ncbi:hypothetical protein DPMN_156820 [Dreissena polymorpha]|uniref:Uncharacterized protein n=1 Tax=Dreissena polymorpha TaxID=45954 RepID=A0A9D4JC65_DREPO|nr:hypothetical protein DPMN_156820 [Dreissena polymorpha]
MNRRAAGDLKESVEHILARYRNERRDLFDRLQEPEKREATTKHLVEPSMSSKVKASQHLTDADVALPAVSTAGDATPKEKKQPGLAERVLKILTHDPEKEDSDTSHEKGMAKKVYEMELKSDPREATGTRRTEELRRSERPGCHHEDLLEHEMAE